MIVLNKRHLTNTILIVSILVTGFADASTTSTPKIGDTITAQPVGSDGLDGIALPATPPGTRWKLQPRPELTPRVGMAPHSDTYLLVAIASTPIEEVESLSNQYFQTLLDEIASAKITINMLNASQASLDEMTLKLNETIAIEIRNEVSFFNENSAVNFASALYLEAQTAEEVRDFFQQAARAVGCDDAVVGSILAPE